MTHTEPAHEAPKIVVEPLVRAVQLAPLAEAIRYVSDFLRIEIRREVAAARMEVDTLRAKIEAVEKMFDDAAIEVEPPWHSDARYEAGRSHALRWAAGSIRAALAGAVPGSPPEPAVAADQADAEKLRGDIHHLLSPIIGGLRLHAANDGSWPIDAEHAADRLMLALGLMDEAVTGEVVPDDWRGRHGVGLNHYPSLVNPDSSPCFRKHAPAVVPGSPETRQEEQR